MNSMANHSKTRIRGRTNAIFATALLPWLAAGCSVVADEKGAPARQLIRAAEPLALEPNPAKPMRYFQQMWGSGVYPIGNGRLGCTVYGGMAEERLQFNEDTVMLRPAGED